MIPKNRLEEISHVITHKDCADGVASAMILKLALPHIKISFIQYDSEEHRSIKPEPGLLFCDFSPHREHVEGFLGTDTLVLDHHKKYEETIRRFGENGVFADEVKEPGVSGALLAYREVYVPLRGPNPAVEEFATITGIRDTWQKKHELWLKACEQGEALSFWPPDMLVGQPPSAWPAKLEIGQVLFAKTQEYAADMVEKCHRFTTPAGTRVVLFGGVKMTSDVAERLGSAADLVVGFKYKISGDEVDLIYSTRSHTHYDCGALCTAHGGGGHTKAAGFRVRIDVLQDPNPFEHFRRILQGFETSHSADLSMWVK